MGTLDMKWQQFLSEIAEDSSSMALSSPFHGTPECGNECKGDNGGVKGDKRGNGGKEGKKYNADSDDESQSDVSELGDNTEPNINDDDSFKLTEETKPKCTPLYVSTKTKISYLSAPIDIHTVFWNIPVLKYAVPQEGAIKKQMKFSTTNPADVAAIQDRLKCEVACVNEFVIEHIENPDGRIKFKDQRKISVGLCKKDIVSYRIKPKRAFFNCFVVILRIEDEEDGQRNFKEMHVKVFNTGKLEIPGVKTDRMLMQVQTLLVRILRPIVGEELDFQRGNSETVLINSNFKCGYYINRDALYHVLKYKYRINCNYDACSYPGIQCKFFYVKGSDEQSGQQPMHFVAGEETNRHKKSSNDTKAHYEISFMIFRTGSVLIVGKCNEDVLREIYEFIRTMLETEYMTIGKCLVPPECDLEKKRVPKVRRKVLMFNAISDV
jgi:TATA-box binding protein (TBP) (component of TFIID and TFIIIB)